MSRRVYIDSAKKDQGRKKVHLPLFLVKLPDVKTIEKTLKMQHTCFIAVAFDDYRPSPSDIIQCHRCQNFFHNTSSCNLKERCVKCGQNHSTNKCPKTKGQPPKCCNCSGPQPANYRGCEVFKRILASRKDAGNKQVKGDNRYKLSRCQNDQKQMKLVNNNNRPTVTPIGSTPSSVDTPPSTTGQNSTSTPPPPNIPKNQKPPNLIRIAAGEPFPSPKKPLTPKQFKESNCGIYSALGDMIMAIGDNGNIKIVLQFFQVFLDKFFTWAADLVQIKRWPAHTHKQNPKQYHKHMKSITHMKKTENMAVSIPMRILSWNAQGISEKVPEFESHLLGNEISIAMVSETKLTPDKTIRLNGYKIYMKDRLGVGQILGVLLAIRTNLKHEELPTPPRSLR